MSYKSRSEHYLAYLTGTAPDYPEKPLSRVELYLDYLCKNGGGGDIEEIKRKVEELEHVVSELRLSKSPNATIIGAPKIDNGQVSGFSAENYMQFPVIMDFQSKPFAIDMCFTTADDVTTQQNIFDSKFGLAFAIIGGHFVMAISTNGESWNVGAITGTHTVLANTTYYVRLSWNGSKYTIEYSFDASEYTLDATANSTTQPFPKTIIIGVGDIDSSHPEPFLGTINLNRAYLAINGEVTWQGMVDPVVKAVQDELAGISEDLYSVYPVTLPINSLSKASVRKNAGDYIYTGTHNIIELYNLKQVDTVINGVRFTVDGNTVTLSGTATTSFYYSAIDGAAVAQTELSQYDGRPFPEMRLGISYKKIGGDGSVTPAFIIRSKESGNVVIVQNNTQNFDYSYSTCAKPYMYLQKNAVYDIKFVLAVFPYEITSASPFREETSSVTALSQGVNKLNGYTWGNVEHIDLMEPRFPKKVFVEYKQVSEKYADSNESIYVFVPTNVGYVRWTFVHSIVEAVNSNSWRLHQIDSYESDRVTFRFHITQLGETEMALRIKDSDDFIGGHTHGDEVGNDVFVYVDGCKKSLTELIGGIECDEVRIASTSSLYDPSDSVTEIAKHGKEFVLTSNNVFINQSVKWIESRILNTSYMTMLCLLRGNDSASALQITDTYYDDGNFEEYDIGTAGFTTYPNEYKSSPRRFVMSSNKSGVFVETELVKFSELDGMGSYVFNHENTYNKLYCAYCGGFANRNPHTTQAGELWMTKTRISIVVNKGTDTEV